MSIYPVIEEGYISGYIQSGKDGSAQDREQMLRGT
jgi:hypothetical protein